MSSQRVRNLLTVPLEQVDNPPGHRFSATSLTQPFGAVATGMGVYELAPGNAAWPYHFETVEEEWLIVIDGELTLRTPEGEAVLRAGDVACFPAGAAGAHAVRNHTEAPVRYAMPSSSARYGDAAVYPDSGKVHIASRGFDHRGRLGEPVGYWEGEQ
ncbi:MAG TPA: cupin domain-containing protein [Gaiellaceae bacterium]|nr:cupin domain-containing protein [Gaiellaceae bacterium]